MNGITRGVGGVDADDFEDGLDSALDGSEGIIISRTVRVPEGWDSERRKSVVPDKAQVDVAVGRVMAALGAMGIGPARRDLPEKSVAELAGEVLQIRGELLLRRAETTRVDSRFNAVKLELARKLKGEVERFLEKYLKDVPNISIVDDVEDVISFHFFVNTDSTVDYLNDEFKDDFLAYAFKVLPDLGSFLAGKLREKFPNAVCVKRPAGNVTLDISIESLGEGERVGSVPEVVALVVGEVEDAYRLKAGEGQ